MGLEKSAHFGDGSDADELGGGEEELGLEKNEETVLDLGSGCWFSTANPAGSSGGTTAFLPSSPHPLGRKT